MRTVGGLRVSTGSREYGNIEEALPHQSGIWVLSPIPDRLFACWDVEAIWLDQLSRHFSIDWRDLTYYVAAVAGNGARVQTTVGARDRHAYLDLPAGFELAWAEWGVWAENRPLLVVLRTKHRRPHERQLEVQNFDGYGEARAFLRPSR